MNSRECVVALALCGLWIPSGFVSAEEKGTPPKAASLPDFGIPVTEQQLTDAIQETQDFWAPVRRHIVSDEFSVAEPAVRQQAAAFLKQVHEALHDRLFEGDEATARDLMDYLALRLRKFALYRQLRKVVANDAVLAGLVDRWERAYRDLHALPESERSGRVKSLLALMPDEMTAAGLAPGTIEQAMKTWTQQAECMECMAATEAGKMMLNFEREARQAERPVADLIRSIVGTADWAWIVKPEGRLLGRADFIKAWDDLAQIKAQPRTAARPMAESR